MKHRKFFSKTLLLTFIGLFFISGLVYGALRYVQAPPLKDVINTQIGDCKDSGQITLPLITWGGDIATILANGNSAVTTRDSIFGQKGLNLKLVRMDDFKKQVELYLSGDMPFLRGTMDMINMASEITDDSRVKPIVFYNMTRSVGGDCLVVKEGIKHAGGLKGKTIALQAYGPHVYFLDRVLKIAGLSLKDVNIRWCKDLTGTDNTPVEALYQGDVDAAFVIIPDGLMLTSNGMVGDGSEGSVKGATILMSTKSLDHIIFDVYAVRADYFATHKDEVEAITHGLMLAEQQLKSLFKNKQTRIDDFKATVKVAAEILLDSPDATGDAEALYGDCIYVGFRGNVKFFGDENWPRHFSKVTEEIQTALIEMGMLTGKVALDHARWDYDRLRAGLTDIDDVQSPRFKAAEVAKIVSKKQAMGTLEEGQIFPTLEIFFQPNQNTFTGEMYAEDFTKIVETSSTCGGAVFVVEGHSDPMKYLRRKKEGAPEFELKKIEQSAKNLSLTRAMGVRDSLIDYAKSNGVNLDPSQFTVIGHGIVQPRYDTPKTKEQWLANMRVVFRIIQIEAEEDAFMPLE